MTKLEAEKYAENIRTEADEYAAEVNKKADEYAESVHKEADDNADALLQEAVLKARKIEDETEALRKQSRVFRQRLQLLIETQLELLTKEDWDNLLVGKPIEYPNTETIMEVEKELEEKIDLDEEEFDEESNETSLEESEVMEDSSSAEETTETDAEDDSVDTVANDEDDVYNNESQEGDYEEGTMPAVELPEAAEE